MKKAHSSPPRQQGMTLLLGLIMLLLITMLTLSAIRMASTNVQVVGNEQFHDEAVAAANFVLDQIASDNNFVTTYSQASGVTMAAVDVGQATYKVVVPKMKCKRSRPVMNSELVSKVNGKDSISAADRACIGGQGSGEMVIAGGTNTSPGGASLCSTVLWDVEAEVIAEGAAGAAAKIHQGIEVRVDTTDVTNYCK